MNVNIKNKSYSPVLHHGRLYHRRRGRVAATSQKTKRNVYRYRMPDLLFNWAFVHYGSEYIFVICVLFNDNLRYISGVLYIS